MEQQKKNQFSLPLAIIVAGILIAGAIVVSKRIPGNTAAVQQTGPISEAIANGKSAGASEKALEACINDRTMQERVARDTDNASALGIGGTPHSIIISSSGETFGLSGALPIEIFEQVIAIMRAGTPRGSEAFAADDLQGIVTYIVEHNALPTIEGDLSGNVLPVDASDHMRGSEAPDITIVEYSDFECPFCTRHHDTMKELLARDTGVAWVYRHLPLTALHDGAQVKAEASECVAAGKGNDAFWAYADANFAMNKQAGN